MSTARAARSALLLAVLAQSRCSGSDDSDLTCQVAVVGGGVGGLHTAFRLADTLGDEVCLFEKEAELGGRFRDISLGDDPQGPRVGAGARRIMEGQKVVFDLAAELGIEVQEVPGTVDLIHARGAFAFSKDAEIRAQQAYQDIVGVKTVTITQWWPTAWYERIVDPLASSDNRVWRAWTTEHCLNFIEIPLEPYAAAAKVTRSVYTDDLECSNYWEALAYQGTASVEAEVKKGLEHLFVLNGGMDLPGLTP